MRPTLLDIRNNLETHIGDNIKITAVAPRNRVKIFNGVLKEVYRSVFIVEFGEECHGVSRISYNYTDILLENISIEYLES
jgi:uncharacterized protein Veg